MRLCEYCPRRKPNNAARCNVGFFQNGNFKDLKCILNAPYAIENGSIILYKDHLDYKKFLLTELLLKGR